MSKFYSQLWTGGEYRYHRRNAPGLPLRHAASNAFNERGLGTGDKLYVWSFVEGCLLLIGRMEVDAVVSFQEAVRRLGTNNFSSTLRDHAIARVCTNKQFGNEVPLSIIRQLGFISPNGEVSPPKFRAEGEPDPQTFRGVRQLTLASAKLLDALL
jgi:hypothetical protein